MELNTTKIPEFSVPTRVTAPAVSATTNEQSFLVEQGLDFSTYKVSSVPKKGFKKIFKTLDNI